MEDVGSSAESSTVIEFGRFHILPYRRELLADGRPVELGARAFDVLMALVESRGSILSKDELMKRAWPGRIVEENCLQVQISTLRKAFAADRELIRTVAGRGYYFAGEIHAVANSSVSPYPTTNLPQPVSELICRDSAVIEVADMVTTHRLVTLTGTGGIGKTRLGIEVARRILPRFPDGVFVVELGSLSDPQFVATVVATTLRLTLPGGEASHVRIAKALESKQLLLLLDNCEHVIEAVACMAETLLRACPGTYVITTSREPLRAEGEFIYHVPPLDVPSEETDSVEDLLRTGAVKLFLARARAADHDFTADHRAIKVIGGICRRLDGIPLAIELAAACIVTLGVEEVASRLHDLFRLLTGGRRTALPRHQTLRATLDWSYVLLPEPERLVLRRLAVFVEVFTMEMAIAVVADGEIVACDVINCIANLVTKSLVVTTVSGAIQYYRLLETTRAYAIEKLSESGEFDLFARRHAEYFREVFERAEAGTAAQRATQGLAAYRNQIGNVRAALDWAFSPHGDAEIGAALTAASVPLWFQVSLMYECISHVKRALASSESGKSRNLHWDMKLYGALGALTSTLGTGVEMKAAWYKALEIAQDLNNSDYELRALWGLCIASIMSGEHRSALEYAQKFSELATRSADPADLLVGERMIGVSLHILGDQVTARWHIEHMLSQYYESMRRSHTIRFQYDQSVAARAILSRILWLQGFSDQAQHIARSNVDDARAIDHVLSMCHALALAACPIALLTGDLEVAGHYIAMLLDHSARHSLTIWYASGRALESVLLMKRGNLHKGVQQLCIARNEHRKFDFSLFDAAFLGNLAEGFAGLGQVAEGLIIINEALARSEQGEERWCLAELLRIKGELLLLQSEPDRVAAEDHFRQAIKVAHEQGVLAWELRAATSLARLRQEQDRLDEGLGVLQPIYNRFSEGFETADLVAAKTLLTALG